MKIVILGITGISSNEEIEAAAAKFAESLNTNIRVHIFGRDDLFPTPNIVSGDTEFIRACTKINEVCGDIVHNSGDRSVFYKLVLEKKIERPILEVIAFGPKSKRELNALRDMGGKEFVKIVQTALSLIATL